MRGTEGEGLKDGMFPRLSFSVDDAVFSRFLLLLQKGFMMRARVGCSVSRFLREEVGAGPDAVEKIQSIFLDGSPVDDLDSATLRDGSTLALSAALPGLVGATLRRGGAYSSFRSTITYREAGVRCVSGEGSVHVKLFNLLIGELGPGLLERGILVKSSDLMTFLREQPEEFRRGCRLVLLDGRPVEPTALRDTAWPSGKSDILLSVTILGDGQLRT